MLSCISNISLKIFLTWFVLFAQRSVCLSWEYWRRGDDAWGGCTDKWANTGYLRSSETSITWFLRSSVKRKESKSYLTQSLKLTRNYSRTIKLNASLTSFNTVSRKGYVTLRTTYYSNVWCKDMEVCTFLSQYEVCTTEMQGTENGTYF